MLPTSNPQLSKISRGDICEDQIKVIAADLSFWIDGDGPVLSFPRLDLSSNRNLTHALYKSEMEAVLGAAHLECVNPGDHGYPVIVGNSRKTCKNYIDSLGTKRIICDRALFDQLNSTERYVLVHHEYAGLAGIEQSNGDDSIYFISNQIPQYLNDASDKKLSIPAKGGVLNLVEIAA